MTIDETRVKAIVDSFSKRDPLEAYYAKFSVQRNAEEEVTADASAVIETCMRKASCVLDIGCGNGWRLLQNRHLFDHGTGIDTSAYVIGAATGRAVAKKARNVNFMRAAAVGLPLADESFDLVYSERGPLGYYDPNLLEVLRVLRPGGELFVETLGSLNQVESREVFDGYDASAETLLTSLEGERRRFERVGIQITLLSSMQRRLVFADPYEWLAWQCSIWRYLERPQPWPTDIGLLTSFAQQHAASDGAVSITYHVIWIGGAKPLA